VLCLQTGALSLVGGVWISLPPGEKNISNYGFVSVKIYANIRVHLINVGASQRASVHPDHFHTSFIALCKARLPQTRPKRISRVENI